MSHPSESETPHDDSALDEIVREAGEILVTPQPKHLEQLRKAVLSRLTVERSRHWRLARRSILATGSVAAAVMLGIVVWQSQHSVSLAEVSQALRERPWIHAKAKEPRVSGEWWLSLTREVSARRDDEFAIFDDHRLGVRYEYDPQEKKLYRVPRSDRKEFGSVGALFRAILGGREFGGSELGGDEIVARSRRKINEENRTWIEYELTLRRHSSLSLKDAISAKMVLRVDPRSHLPATMKLKHLVSRSKKSSSSSITRRKVPSMSILWACLGQPRWLIVSHAMMRSVSSALSIHVSTTSTPTSLSSQQKCRSGTAHRESNV